MPSTTCLRLRDSSLLCRSTIIRGVIAASQFKTPNGVVLYIYSEREPNAEFKQYYKT